MGNAPQKIPQTLSDLLSSTEWLLGATIGTHGQQMIQYWRFYQDYQPLTTQFSFPILNKNIHPIQLITWKKIISNRLLWSLNFQPPDHQSAIIVITPRNQLWVGDREFFLNRLQSRQAGSSWIQLIHLIKQVQYKNTNVTALCDAIKLFHTIPLLLGIDFKLSKTINLSTLIVEHLFTVATIVHVTVQSIR